MAFRSAEEKIELTGILSEFREALEEEIDKIKKSGQSSTLLFGGRQIESHGADRWYRFNVEYVPSLPADTPCKLVIGKDQCCSTVSVGWHSPVQVWCALCVCYEK
jgi:hypothetical protein